MPLGVGVQLRDGTSGFFLGDVKWGEGNVYSGYGVVTRFAWIYRTFTLMYFLPIYIYMFILL